MPENRDEPKIALIVPQAIGYRQQIRKALPPLGLGYIAGVLEEKGYDKILFIDAVAEDYSNVVQLKDDPTLVRFGMSDEMIADKVRTFKPDIIGITVLFSSQVECAFSAAKALKSVVPDTPIVLGGIHASIMYEDIMREEKAIDFILAGEADYTFSELVEKLYGNEDYTQVPGLVWRDDSGIRKNPQAVVVRDVDKLPFPAWHLMDMERYFSIAMPHNPFVRSGRVGCIMTSRGCPQHCYFCSSAEYFGHLFRPMSAKRVVEMVQYMVDRFEIKELQVLDDNATLDYKRVIDICEGIKNMKLRITFPNGIRADVPKDHKKRADMLQAMRDAGTEQISISVEHGDQDFLNNVMCKRQDLQEAIVTCDLAHRAGLLVHASFMMGFPFEVATQRQRTADFAKELDADSFSVSLATPLPGTPMWDLVERHGLFMDSFNPNRVLYGQVSIKPHDILPEDLYSFVEKLNRQLNEAAREKRPESAKKYKLFKGKTADGDRKYLIVDKKD
ncbi:MAG: cobalamin-dependent protein [Candidatus Omnitrophota bacterium]